MKANELRIGNIVSTWNGIKMKLDEDDLEIMFGARNYEDFYPIPLTPEILEKCGFEKSSFTQWRDNYFTLTDIDTKYLFCKSESIEVIATIQYLHQLQNLYFALTGNELNINL